MPRPLQIFSFREFAGQYDGVSIEAAPQQASILRNLYPNSDLRGLKRRGGFSPLGSGNLSPNQDLDGLMWYLQNQPAPRSEKLVGAHDGRLYDFAASAAVTNSTGKLTSGTDANGAWIDGMVYWGDGVKQNIVHDGNRVDQAMVDAVSSAPTVANGGGTGPTGTYTYKVTFVSADGFDGEPGPASASITVANDEIDLTNIPTCGAGQDCSARRIWRNKNGGTVYYLLTTIADNSTTTYTDTTTDANLGATELVSGNTRFPPCRFLIAHQNRLIGAFSAHADGDKQTVYVSNYRQPYYSPASPDLEDPNQGTRIALQGPAAGEITGLCSHGDKVAVFTGGAAFLLTTSDQLLDYTLYLFSNHGCVAHRTIRSVKDMLIWLGPDGVYMAREGQGVTRISDDVANTILAKSAAVMGKAHAYVFQDRYHLCWTTGALWFDLKTGIWGENSNWLWRVSAQSTFFDAALERVWAAISGSARVHQLETGTTDNGTAITATWRSKATDFGLASREKRLRRVECKWKAGSGTATVTLYRETGTTAFQTATKDLAEADVTGATIATLKQDCKEQARAEFFEIQVSYAGSAAEYQLLQVDASYVPVT